jgi:hypothetical protein
VTEVAPAEAESGEPIDSAATPGEIAVSPDPGVVSAIAAMESAFPNATPSSPDNVAWAGELAMAHKMPGATEAPVVAADSEVATLESPATISTEPMAEATAPDADSPPPDATTAAPEPPQMPVPSIRVEPTGQAAAEVPPPQSVAARARHRSAPRKSANPSLQPPPGEGEAPSSDNPDTQD